MSSMPDQEEALPLAQPATASSLIPGLAQAPAALAVPAPRTDLVMPIARPDQPHPVSAPPTGRVTRWLRHPWSMLVVIPGLMLIVGLSLIALSRSSLQEENAQNWRDRLSDDSATIAEAAGQALSRAQPLLHILRDDAEEQANRPADLTRLMTNLVSARSSIAALSILDASGLGLRARVDRQQGGIHIDHYIRALFAVPADDTIFAPAVSTGRAAFLDPSQRALMIQALADEQPHWSGLYRMTRTGIVTLSCAQSLTFAHGSDERGLVMIDFDAESMDRVLNGVIPHTGDTKPYVFSATGTLLVMPTPPTEPDGNPGAGARSLADVLAHLPASGEVSYFDHSPEGLPVMSAVRRVEIEHGPVLYASVVAPITSLAASTKRLVVTSLWIEVAAVVGASGMAWLLTRVLTHQRQQVQRAEESAREARARLEALGSYTLVKRLGGGGMGEIWEAVHQLLARPAALKLISMSQVAKTEEERHLARTRFAREARATANLRSPHTVTVYDFGFTRDGSFYYAMELLDGLDLERLVLEHGVQLPSRVIQILIQVCRSLAEAHQQGLVHRDIKPANICLCRLGLEVDVAKVLDFGLVASVGGAGRAGTVGVVQGTPAYMAPEQARGLGPDARSDLYALGGVAYWLLAGRTLFDESDPQRMMSRQIHDPPQPLERVAPQAIPEALYDVVAAMLQKEPNRRPHNADEVIRLLESIAIEEEDAWSPTRARAWWALYHPQALVNVPRTDSVRTATIILNTPAQS
jgi:serine/threonine protein kinase